MKRRNSLRKLLTVGGFVIALTIAGATSAIAQNQPQKPAYTMEEYKAFDAANKESDPQAQIKLLDDFTSKFPDSVLMPHVYSLDYRAFYSLKEYSQAVEYADKVVALSVQDEIRLSALSDRAKAYSEGCDDPILQKTEASAKAEEAADEGLRLLDRLSKPTSLTDKGFADQKTWYAMIFNSEAEIARMHIKGDPALCVPSPPQPQPEFEADHSQFDRLMQDLLDEQRQTPTR